MNEHALKKKSFAFAVRIVHACKFLCEHKKAFALSDQLLRAGTAMAHYTVKPYMPKAKRISFINSPWHRKNAAKLFIGLNFCKRPISSTKNLSQAFIPTPGNCIK